MQFSLYFAAVWLSTMLGFPSPVAYTASALQDTTVKGTVVDSSGGVVQGATVTIEVAGATRSLVTDGLGRFSFAGLVTTPSRMTVAREGFVTRTVRQFPDGEDISVVLDPAAIREEVAVIGQPTRDKPVVSAMRANTAWADVPQAMSIISKQMISDLGMRSMADVTRYVAGVGMAQGEGNRDTPIFRGNTSTSDFFVDGIRDDAQYFRDLYNVERVEALKGPNAMIFGRGGVGGVINRVTRQADWRRTRGIVVEGGSYADRRVSADISEPFGAAFATRVNAVYEDSGSYREGVQKERYGINPTLAFTAGARTVIRGGYEYFRDTRTADRGVPSFNGAPLRTEPGAFFGNAAESRSDSTVHAATAAIDHQFRHGWTLRSRARLADYDKFYQNVFAASAVDSTGARLNLSGYRHTTTRTNLFASADVTGALFTGRVRHDLMVGTELGRQLTANARNTAYFASGGGEVTAISVPVSNPVATSTLYRRAAIDANNDGRATVAAGYAQDQVHLSSRVEAVVGLRVDRFDVRFEDRRIDSRFSSRDTLLSPRVALIVKPLPGTSIYGSYTLAYLPRAGEQLSSLSLTNQAVDPEKFVNAEVGAKWQPARGIALSAAAYELTRGNVVIADPADVTRSILVDAERTRGIEVEAAGNLTARWSLLGAYAYQDGRITTRLSASVPAGATLAQLPRHSFSLWNRYNLARRLAIGAALSRRGDVFAATDNTVTLPAYTRADAALFLTLSKYVQVQVNVENLTGQRYFLFAHSNNNITPGSPRSARVTLTTKF
ncbi:MAG: TonB-dependent siderophore receptor [Acidobacteria bacterium]|nr:TonB-dependent siderophore receptor [Acidobacteriota bacterium]